MPPWGSRRSLGAHSKFWCMGTQQCQLQRIGEDGIQRGRTVLCHDVKSLAIFKEMKSQARIALWSHRVQTLHFAALERLKWNVRSPQCKKFISEAWNGIAVSCLGRLCLFHYNSVGKSLQFLGPILIDWWRLPGVPLWGVCLCLVWACWRRAWRSSGEGCSRRERVNDRWWHFPTVAVPYNYVF